MDNEQQIQILNRYKNIRGVFFIIFSTVSIVAINTALVAQVRSNATSHLPPSATTTENTAFASYALAEVALHNIPTDCWMAAFGNVYDLTAYVSANDHPGGESSLVSGCGNEMTKTFDDIHSKQAKTDLEGLKIGSLLTQ